MPNTRRVCAILTALVVAAFLLPASASAEKTEVRLAQQFGLPFLPLQVMIHNKLIEKYAAKAGLGNVKVTIVSLGGGAAVNDALLSGSIDFAAGGTGPLLTLWDKTRGNLDVRGIGALVNIPMLLNANRPEVKSLKDFTEKDRIAVPAVRVSIQAVVLQMAGKKLFNDPSHFDRLTVTMKHPDAAAALLGGHSFISAHFAVPPFSYIELKSPKIHTVVSSYDIVGGKHMQDALYTTKKFMDENPKLSQAVYDALHAAMDVINKDKKQAARIYLDVSKSKASPAFIEKILNNPDIEYTTTPSRVMEFATFLHESGRLKHLPKSWKDVFWKTVDKLPGS